jgi:hypothetical protein
LFSFRVDLPIGHQLRRVLAAHLGVVAPTLRVRPDPFPRGRLAVVVGLEKLPIDHAEAEAGSDGPGLEEIACDRHSVHGRDGSGRVIGDRPVRLALGPYRGAAGLFGVSFIR